MNLVGILAEYHVMASTIETHVQKLIDRYKLPSREPVRNGLEEIDTGETLHIVISLEIVTTLLG